MINSDNGKLVLVVEDDEDIREVVVESLRDAGFDPVIAASAAEAEALLATTTPALMLLDYLMPETNGLELLDKLARQGRYPSCPVVLASASRDAPTRFTSAGVRLAGTLRKPFTLKELLAMVRRQTNAPPETGS